MRVLPVLAPQAKITFQNVNEVVGLARDLASGFGFGFGLAACYRDVFVFSGLCSLGLWAEINTHVIWRFAFSALAMGERGRGHWEQKWIIKCAAYSSTITQRCCHIAAESPQLQSNMQYSKSCASKAKHCWIVSTMAKVWLSQNT